MKVSKKIVALMLCGLFCLLTACGTKTTGTADDGKVSGDETVSETVSAPAEKYGVHHVVISVADYGDISLELDGDTAPITVKNFVDLANSGFYNGLTFHRIIREFMVQGGDPKGNGTGGSRQTIKGEFAANGVENPISHKRGVISMARNRISMDSASSQFFICQVDYPSLDGQYAAFGHVTAGIEVVDALCERSPGTGPNGLVLENQPVITSVTVVD